MQGQKNHGVRFSVTMYITLHIKVPGGQITFQERIYSNKPHPVASLSCTQTPCKTSTNWQLDAKPQAPKSKIEIQVYAAIAHLKPRGFLEANANQLYILRPFPIPFYHSIHFLFLHKRRRNYGPKNGFFFRSSWNVESV